MTSLREDQRCLMQRLLANVRKRPNCHPRNGGDDGDARNRAADRKERKPGHLRWVNPAELVIKTTWICRNFHVSHIFARRPLNGIAGGGGGRFSQVTMSLLLSLRILIVRHQLFRV